MKNFGNIFKKFRESRGLSLKDIANEDISKSQLSRFENNETDLTITKFMSALDRLKMPIDEFMYAVNDFHGDELSELLSQIRTNVINQDVIGLRKLLHIYSAKETNRATFHHLNTILIKIRLQTLSKEDIVTEGELASLTDYLFSVDYWGNYELRLFLNTIDVLNHNLFMRLSREMLNRSDFYSEIKMNRDLISHMTLNAFITCIERNQLMDALYFDKQLKSFFFDESEMYERIVYKYAKNYYDYRKNGSNASIIEMKKCVDFMKAVGSDHIASHYEEHLEKISIE
ncbi:transcriptional activator, Rgg/GadR/MutR family, C-terminal domain-containing protein [Streptococcus henryi]|uniref:Transcriptional activator, Rgg/GadR/MutR family, C-terminal domain-containing protein n=1 Tax=Streptococcus henryi TaxID=439219 RepID=A0A1G6BFE6_9STRE|nr:Rgg/GadR/MutR family transcriptional regulator [Streptococcus henryi]SDB19377.1 transcriptional activator, Rgg/GadR/MutR family, C-terminal domain-containing protein [Streptococcus henryi]